MKNLFKLTMLLFLMTGSSFAQFNAQERDHDVALIYDHFEKKEYAEVIALRKDFFSALGDSLKPRSKERKYLLTHSWQRNALIMMSNSYEILGKLDSAIYVFDFIIKNDRGISRAYDTYYNYSLRGQLKLKKGDKAGACEDFNKAAGPDFSGYPEWEEAVRLRDENCKAMNDKAAAVAMSKKVRFFSIIGMDEKQVAQILGKPKGKIFEHHGSTSYDCYTYVAVKGKYNIAFKSGRAFMIVLYPTVKQRFDEDQLLEGGKFDLQNDTVGGCTGQPNSGRAGKVSYIGIDFNCASEMYSIVYYGAKGGFVTKAMIY